MTESSARVFSASKQAPLQLHQGQVCLGAQDIHVWLSDRDEFSGSSAFLRRILSQYADVCEADWEFVRGEHGKPMLVGAPKNLDFNLSHSGERLACAITAGSPVGVDLEQCKQGRDVMRVARRFFCADEDKLEDTDPKR